MAPSLQPSTLSEPTSNGATSPHLPAHAWTYRVPSPPRIIVPPPILHHLGSPSLGSSPTASQDYEPIHVANAEFLSTVTYGDFTAVSNILDWKYEYRRLAQKILPFLYLGPITAAKNRAFLDREGITMLLAVRNTTSAQAKLLDVSRIAGELGLHSVTIDVADNQELIAAFPRVIQDINTHMQDKYLAHGLPELKTSGNHLFEGRTNRSSGKVLVFCETGNERSAGVVAAYLIAMYNMSFIKTIQILQAQRFCIAFDDSMKVLLQTYATMVQAKRDVTRSAHPTAAYLEAGEHNEESVQRSSDVTLTKGEKRNLVEAYGADEEMGNTFGHFDDSRFEGRDEVSAPFQDSPFC